MKGRLVVTLAVPFLHRSALPFGDRRSSADTDRENDRKQE